MSEEQKNVTIYSTPTCAFCNMAKEFFKEHAITYTEYDVATDTEKRNEMIAKSGQMGVPVIFIGEEMIIGFDEAKVRSSLGL
ncbi:MAG: NrdH-redoxin [Candidatus Ryanbacteria bacterium CG10_big_fil_rev_8_21_14_0_10_43_42]|uniref:NrdH-redoxin n=1 Tax=Candidatus Ryanbacteria bacterium CG10_big_fil_rev_8_21_14_0_10_43_42 TaxID=1974864 RepID=A0A2M8KVW6_9BACT|nr:MAG: NrdH-redoxin [Candidatus Ryanbacteria bacterium CG10_big_fil_rev_8_21_14_0_10_43_42]